MACWEMSVARTRVSHWFGLRTKIVLEAHGEGIGLFTAGTARAPDGQDLVLLMALFQLRQNGLLEEREVILLPEKVGIVGGELVENQLQILRVLGGEQMLQKRLEIVISPALERLGEPAGNQLALFAQVNAVVLLNKPGPDAENPRR